MVTVVIKTIFVILGWGLILAGYLSPVDYTKQLDFRARQYHPATIIDMSTRELCDDACWTEYSVSLELTDFTVVEDVSVTSNTFDEYKLGDIINLERHITDPVTVKQRNRTVGFIFGGVMFLILSFLIFLFED